jgi:hypothetical protein
MKLLLNLNELLPLNNAELETLWESHERWNNLKHCINFKIHRQQIYQRSIPKIHILNVVLKSNALPQVSEIANKQSCL